jgi:hypothetical protein
MHQFAVSHGARMTGDRTHFGHPGHDWLRARFWARQSGGFINLEAAE